MPVGYAEANIVFLTIDIVAALFMRENHSSRQPVLLALRPEWISSFHSDASAQRSGGTIPPLALTILGPIIVNILLIHGLMNSDGIGLAILVTIFWGVVFVSVRSAFAGIFQTRVDMTTAPARRPVRINPQPPKKSSNGSKHMKNILLIQSSPRGAKSLFARAIRHSHLFRPGGRGKSLVLGERQCAHLPIIILTNINR